MAAIDQASLREALIYDPKTGIFLWRTRPRHQFNSDSSHRAWNTRYANKKAFCTTNGRGYLVGAILNKRVLAHRVAWCLTHGYWPKFVDHINGNRADNRIVNLRAVTSSENAKNRKRRSDNTSGRNGVYWRRDVAKWIASIKVGGRLKHLGYFTEFGAAVEARKRAELPLNFHENHGRLEARH